MASGTEISICEDIAKMEDWTNPRKIQAGEWGLRSDTFLKKSKKVLGFLLPLEILGKTVSVSPLKIPQQKPRPIKIPFY